MIGENGVYVMGLAQRIPSASNRSPPCATKSSPITGKTRRVELAKAAGTRFESELDAGLSQGKTFDTMCAAQFIRPLKLSPFSLTSTSVPELADKSKFAQVQEVAGKMHPGQCSPFIPTEDGGFILYFKSELPVDDSLVQRELPDFSGPDAGAPGDCRI